MREFVDERVEVGDGPGGVGEADADGGFLESVGHAAVAVGAGFGGEAECPVVVGVAASAGTGDGGVLVRVAANPAAGKDALDLACIAIIRKMAGVPEGPIVAAGATGPVACRERALRDGCLARAEDIAAMRTLPGPPGERPSERVVAEQVHVRREAARVYAVIESAGRELHSDAIEVEVVLGGNHPRQ